MNHLPAPMPEQTNPYQKAIPWVAWLLCLVLFEPVFCWLIHVWTTSFYDVHGALVPLIAAGMMLSRRQAILHAPCAPSFIGLFVTGTGLVILLASQLANFNLLGGVALVVVVTGMVWTLWGRTVLRLVSFPLAFLLLMLPINYPLEMLIGFQLRILSTKLSALLLGWLGVATQVHGTIITTSHFVVSIESPCSGLKTLSALLLVGLLLAYFLHKDWWRRSIIILAVAPMALVANALRNTTIILIGHNYGEQAAMGWLHGFSGLVVFLLAIVLLILLSETLLWRPRSASS